MPCVGSIATQHIGTSSRGAGDTSASTSVLCCLHVSLLLFDGNSRRRITKASSFQSFE